VPKLCPERAQILFASSAARTSVARSISRSCRAPDCSLLTRVSTAIALELCTQCLACSKQARTHINSVRRRLGESPRPNRECQFSATTFGFLPRRVARQIFPRYQQTKDLPTS
jgi:hypothetical protein